MIFTKSLLPLFTLRWFSQPWHDIAGADESTWFIDLKSGAGSLGPGEAPSGANCTMTLDSNDFTKMFAGELKPVAAFMAGKLKIKGDMALAMKLEKLMNKMTPKL